MFGFWRKRPPPAPPQVASNARIYAIGDVHGRADLLADLVVRIKDDIARQNDDRAARIVLLGDYIDRGEQSRAVLDQVMALHSEGAVCLMGNHEAALLDFLDEPEESAEWLAFGGLQTLASYGVVLPHRRDRAALQAAADTLRAAMGPHVHFLRDDLLLFYESGNVVFVHAAMDPGVSLDAQSEEALMWGNRAFLERGWRSDRTVVHGHYAALEPVEAPGRICIDTGAYYSHCLTALRLDAVHKFL